jgi:hypothetical protein
VASSPAEKTSRKSERIKTFVSVKMYTPFPGGKDAALYGRQGCPMPLGFGVGFLE